LRQRHPIYGDTILQAQVGNAAAPGPRLATREILVQPDGTFRLVGAIQNDGYDDIARSNAVTVAATSGGGAP
jgi:hypothetical protein